ncbi:MAG TPA: DoxX family protein [Dinghuibacter sp.]|jgi:hypothetical protein|uniref:DoxX family protein n=1 Tax=Dinghuibacter sp. TaxID=2024697 RepID=UPI002B7F4F54|nr:DoxX family protein [Dinghuibacter sp.]HTJ13318.1 DoxX family protein [Dinghuibacter sp.]
MKTTNILYWVFMGLFCLLMAFSGVSGLIATPDGMKVFTTLGYPLYFAGLLSAAKILGVIALLVPGFPRLKEWAFAGFAIDLVSAAYSLTVVSHNGYLMILPIALFVATYVFYRRRQARITAASPFNAVPAA